MDATHTLSSLQTCHRWKLGLNNLDGMGKPQFHGKQNLKGA
jgi:hypothetical protein